ncbi:tripartite motif-containing protein 45-like [Haliotis rufescens]|uniref:tripartite motif-containing protein 45-like n=1 Tax=Haliotis rufescens TaxID=6454 RepID=UPI001EB05CD6|nr:tripartite motif-containing protein 45-like [Haliotis rufescens]
MSEPQAKVDMSALKDTFLECPVCVEHFNQTDRRPRLLHSCFHAFCTQCLQQLLTKEGKGQITCPLCRQVHKVPGKADILPVDPVRAKLVDFVQIKNERKVPCTDCPEGSTAESKCQECSVYLCKDCTYVHRRHRLTNDHPIISLSDVLEQPLNTFGKGHFCTHHPKHQLEFYCATDEILCCISCTVLEHKGHDFQKLEKAAKKIQGELETSMRAVQANAQQLRQRRLCEEKRQHAIMQAQRKAKSDVSTYCTSLTSIINKRKAHLDQDIDQRSSTMLSLSKKKVAAIDQTLAVMDSTETYFTQARTKADVVEMLQMYPAIKRSLEASAVGQRQGRPTAPEVVTFSPTNGHIVETLVSEIGCVRESTDTQKGKNQLLQCLDEVFDAALKFKSKNELMKHFQEKTFTTEREWCTICLNQIVEAKKIQCGHCFCKSCIDQVLSVQDHCPVCKTCYKVITGNMPPGVMETHAIPDRLPGYEQHHTIQITYSFENGIQSKGHPRPGVRYNGGEFTAYLPNSPEGQKVLALLEVAWERKLTFTIEAGLWNPTLIIRSPTLIFRIPHKTKKQFSPNIYQRLWAYQAASRDSEENSNFYPDPDYLRRVQESLKSLGVTEADLQ